VSAYVDVEKRKETAVHHTATHLLHAALRYVLGSHVVQKGSLVNADYLRFDFAHFARLTPEEILQVEKLVNKKIREDVPVVVRIMPREEAMKTGAMALFGEKYGDQVRVVSVDPTFSNELCGGTHVPSSGEIGFFKIRSESAIAAGVRRIEAVAGRAAEEFVSQEFGLLAGLRDQLKNPKDLLKAITEVQAEVSQLRKKAESMELKMAEQLKADLIPEIIPTGGYAFLGRRVEGYSAESLRKVATDLSRSFPQAAILLAGTPENRPTVILGLGEDLLREKNLDAAKIIRETVAPLIRGGGGGQKSLASAGGQDPEGLGKAIEAVRNLLML